jgi:hypothetical protein
VTITPVQRTIFRTSDGAEYATKADAIHHEFRLAINRWAESNLYSGMMPHEVADAIVDGREQLKTIFEEYL